MAVGRRKDRQEELWTPWAAALSPGHPFYARLNEVLAAARFDEEAEKLCAPYYAEKMGRPGIPPGVYFRMLAVGFFERIDSERGIAWRCADSLSIKAFLGYAAHEQTPDHSTVSRTRRRLPLEVHQEVFQLALEILNAHGLIDGKTIGVDATTLEANAAMRSIVRRDTGQAYDEFLKDLARESGIETPTRADLAKIDRKRPNKGSNDDWTHPHDGDAQITKMKDGRTHMGHKAEHAVDLEGDGAVLSVTLHGGAAGDTRSMPETVGAAEGALEQLDESEGRRAPDVVGDKGYHSRDAVADLASDGHRTYIAEPGRGRQKWKDQSEEQAAVYANRRRNASDRGKRLQRKRGELLERAFTHYLDGGGMRRTHLRGHANILKRLLIHVVGFNLGLMMRKLFGAGTPRAAAALGAALFILVWTAKAAAGLIRPAFDPAQQKLLPPPADNPIFRRLLGHAA